jgi:hypothetical protein
MRPMVDEDIAMSSQSVPRWLVHKNAIAEVLLTRWEPLGDDNFLVGAQWPRDHGIHGPVHTAWHDPLLLAETIRQAGQLLSHAEYGVPPGHHFLMNDLSYRTEPGPLTIGPQPAEITLLAACSDIRRRGRTLGGMRLSVAFHRDSLPLGTAEVGFRCLSPEVYGRIRPLRELAEPPVPEPVDPSRVGRDRPRDVVLAPSGEPGRWLLRADRSHPTLFDHPVDHVPGMVVLEAIRQIAVLCHHPEPRLPIGISTAFSRYVEHDAPCLLEARTVGPDELEVTATQNGVVCARAQVTTMPCGS